MGARMWARSLRWLLPAALVAVFWIVVAQLHERVGQRPTGPEVRTLDSGRFAADSGLRWPPPVRTEPALLPDDWSRTRPEVRAGWYQLAFELPEAPQGDLALYLSDVNARPALRLNGRRLVIGGGFARPTARSWHIPVYVTVPDGVLQAGSNTLQVGFEMADAGTGYVGEIHLGPAARLRAAYEFRHFLQVTLPQGVALAVALFSALLFALFALRPRESVYGWVAAVFAVLALGFVNILVLDSRIPRPPAAWIGVVTMAWFGALGLVFTHRLFGLRRPRLERALLAIAALGTLAWTLAHPPTDHPLPLALWGAFWLGVAMIPGWLVLREHARRGDFETALMFTTGLLIVTCSLHDVGLVNGALTRDHDSTIQYAVAASIVSFAWIFLQRFIRALHTAEALTATLEQRVADKHAELERNYERMRQLERQRTLSAERERILGEIHDGLGGQLVSTLAMTEGGRADLEDVSRALRDALDDLRLMIHSLDASAQDLLTVLGAWRGRIQPRLEAAGVRVRWEVEDLPDLPELGPERTLHVLRIFQEAVTNALKHAKATTLTLRTGTGVDPGGAPGAFVELADDGLGLSDADGPAGHGRGQMERRARAAGGRLEVHSDAGGTRVRLWLPRAAPSPEAGMVPAAAPE